MIFRLGDDLRRCRCVLQEEKTLFFAAVFSGKSRRPMAKEMRNVHWIDLRSNFSRARADLFCVSKENVGCIRGRVRPRFADESRSDTAGAWKQCMERESGVAGTPQAWWVILQ